MRVLGVDPGGAYTGIVLRQRDAVVWTTCIARGDRSRREYVGAVLTAMSLLRRRLDLVAVEDVNDPTPQMGTIAVGGLLGCAVVLGAVIAWCSTDACPYVVVPPGGHGSAPKATYPAVLVGRRPPEFPGEGPRSHEQSAYDVAAAGRQAHRINAAIRSQETARGH